MTIQIKTNNIPRPVVYGYELPEKDKSTFDYVDFENDDGSFNTFFKYKGQVYDLNEFVRIEQTGKRTNSFTHTTDDNALLQWHGIISDSYFSGIVIKLIDNGESVIVGQYTS